MLIGFSLASLFLVQVFVVIESNYFSIRRFISESHFAAYSITCGAELSYYDYYFNNNNSFEGYPLPTNFNNIIMETIDQSPLKEKLPLSSTNFQVHTFSALSYESVINGSTIGENYILGGAGLYVISDEIFQYIIPFASWDNPEVSPPEYAVLLVASNDLIPSGYSSFPYWEILNHKNITVAVVDNEVIHSEPVTLTFSHKIIYEPFDNNEIGKILNSYINFFGGSCLIITENLFKQLLSSIYATLETIEYPQNFFSRRIFVNAHVIHDVSKLEFTQEEYEQRAQLAEEIEDNLINKMPLLTKIRMTKFSGYVRFNITFRLEQFKLALLALPIVFLLCFSIYYQNQIFNLTKTKLAAFFNIHGVTRSQFLICELVILLIIALGGFVLGICLAFPLFLFGYTSVGLMGALSSTSVIFTGEALLRTASIYWSIIILFSIPLLINRTKSFASLQIKDGKIPSKKTQIILFIISLIITLSLLAVLLFVPRTAYSHFFFYSTSIYFLITFLAISSSMLTITFFLLLITDSLSKSFWRKRHNSFGLSLRNITINKDRFKHGFLSFTLGFMTIILFMSLSFGLITSISDEAKYLTGADARISVSPEANLNVILASIPPTIHMSEVLQIDSVFNQYDRRAVSFYILNTSTFPKVAYYPSGDIGISLQKAMSYLDQTNSCLIGLNRASELGLKTGEKYSMKILQEDIIINQQLEIEALVNVWPFFIFARQITVSGIDVNAPLKIIISDSTSHYLINAFDNLLFNRYLLLDFTNSKSDLQAIKTLVEESDELKDLVTYQEEFRVYLNNPMVRITVNFSIFCGLVAFLITLSSIIFFTQKMFIDQKEQIHLYLSLGALSKQVKWLFFFEVLSLTTLSTLCGVVLGVLSLNVLKEIVIRGQFIGRFSPKISVILLIIFCTLLGVIGFSLLLTYLYITRWIKNELKQFHYNKEVKGVGN